MGQKVVERAARKCGKFLKVGPRVSGRAAAYPAFKNSFRPRLACIVHLCEQDHFDHTNQPLRAVLGHKVHLLTDMLTAECSKIS